jgi:hypothetical protein
VNKTAISEMRYCEDQIRNLAALLVHQPLDVRLAEDLVELQTRYFAARDVWWQNQREVFFGALARGGGAAA